MSKEKYYTKRTETGDELVRIDGEWRPVLSSWCWEHEAHDCGCWADKESCAKTTRS